MLLKVCLNRETNPMVKQMQIIIKRFLCKLKKSQRYIRRCIQDMIVRDSFL